MSTGAKGVMFQFFEWNLEPDGSLWRTLAASAERLASQGVTAVWFPPASKGAAGGYDVGYGVYDLYDLGEFDQKETVRTKYGTKDELVAAVAAVQEHGMDAYLDVVMNHRIGGDETEEVEIVEIDPNERTKAVSDPYVIKAWSRYTCPGRGGQYSDFVWTKDQFQGFGADANQPDVSGKIFRVAAKSFADDVSGEYGNFDYLMGADVDHSREEVREELVRWGSWLLETTGARGVRLDAVKHISAGFTKEWLERIRAAGRPELFAVGEYWTGSIDELEGFLGATGGALRLFDVPLHYRFREAAEKGREYDLRTIFDDTLVGRNAIAAVTFVDNHDSQPGQSLESPIQDWFKPSAYAFILLRDEGYPCVFHGDYFGNEGENKLVSHRTVLDAMLLARSRHMFGDRHEYPESGTLVGWLYTGEEEHPGVMAVVISTADAGYISMDTARPGMSFRDVTGAHEDAITAGEDGRLDFPVNAGSVSVWCSE